MSTNDSTDKKVEEFKKRMAESLSVKPSSTEQTTSTKPVTVIKEPTKVQAPIIADESALKLHNQLMKIKDHLRNSGLDSQQQSKTFLMIKSILEEK